LVLEDPQGQGLLLRTTTVVDGFEWVIVAHQLCAHLLTCM